MQECISVCTMATNKVRRIQRLPVFDQTGQCFDFQPVNKNIKNNSFDLVLKKNTKSGL